MIYDDDFKNSEITFYGISRTIELLNDKIKEYDTDITEIVDCIIKLDEQLNKRGKEYFGVFKQYKEDL